MATSDLMKSNTSTILFSQEFKSFLNDLNGKYPYLSTEEEKVLRNQLADGSVEARNRLVFGSVNYVVKQVCKNPFVNQKNAEDVILGVLYEMLDKAFSYKPEFDVKFITYMNHTIENKIWDLVSSVSTSDRRTLRNYNAVVARLGKDCTDEQIAVELGVKTSTIKDLKLRTDRATYTYSFDAPASDDDDGRGSFLENQLHGDALNPEAEFMEWNAYKTLDDAIAKLPPKEQLVLNLAWGLVPGNPVPLSLREIEAKTGIGRMTVSKLKKSAEDHIKQYLDNAGFAA